MRRTRGLEASDAVIGVIILFVGSSEDLQRMMAGEARSGQVEKRAGWPHLFSSAAHMSHSALFFLFSASTHCIGS